MPVHYERHHLERVTSTLIAKLHYYDLALEHVDRFVSTRFNVLELLAPDEVRLSRVLRDLLDPQGSHGQGDRFLCAFLVQLRRPLPEDGAKVTVTLEAPTRYIAWKGRRMDVQVSYPPHVLAIENKLWAADQQNQVHDYLEELTRHHGSNSCLIYLTPYGTDPASESIEPMARQEYIQANRLSLVSYAWDVPKWLSRCIETCDSDRYRSFLVDLRDYIARLFPDPKEVTA